MAKEDASVAISNALQKLEHQPNLVHKDESLKSLQSNLNRLGSKLDRMNSITRLTQVREIACDAENTMDDAIRVDATKRLAEKRWRKMSNAILFYSRSDKIKQQTEDIQKRTDSIDVHGGDGGEHQPTGPSFECIDEMVEETEVINVEVGEERKLFYLSLSAFPAEVEVSARKLIQIWAAEGFLNQKGSTTMEEQGRDQINWLRQDKYIQPAEKGTCGNIKTFKIGQDKLDDCITAAEQEGFLHVIKIVDSEKTMETDKLKDTMETDKPSVSRLAINIQPPIVPKRNDLRSSSKVRSLQIHSTKPDLRLCDYGFLKAAEFDSLWVLDLGTEVDWIPEAIGKLEHLKYLRLRAPKITRIPASICKLPSLQTIELKETRRVKTMPLEIWKMKTNLRHLHLGKGATALPEPQRAHHYDALQNLQTLCGVRPDKQLKRLMVRAKFPNVRRVRLECTSENESGEFLSFLNSIDLLSNLRSLTLRGPIKNLPEDWNAFPSSMTKMTLWKTEIEVGKCVNTLQNLPNLRYLKLMDDSVVGEEMICAAGRFTALLVLRMIGLKELKKWSVEKGAMRVLEDLVVSECKSLKSVEATQPSKKLGETLTVLRTRHSTMSVNLVYPEPNGTAT